jgi:hypothetical protein
MLGDIDQSRLRIELERNHTNRMAQALEDMIVKTFDIDLDVLRNAVVLDQRIERHQLDIQCRGRISRIAVGLADVDELLGQRRHAAPWVGRKRQQRMARAIARSLAHDGQFSFEVPVA